MHHSKERAIAQRISNAGKMHRTVRATANSMALMYGAVLYVNTRTGEHRYWTVEPGKHWLFDAAPECAMEER